MKECTLTASTKGTVHDTQSIGNQDHPRQKK